MEQFVVEVVEIMTKFNSNDAKGKTLENMKDQPFQNNNFALKLQIFDGQYFVS